MFLPVMSGLRNPKALPDTSHLSLLLLTVLISLSLFSKSPSDSSGGGLCPFWRLGISCKCTLSSLCLEYSPHPSFLSTNLCAFLPPRNGSSKPSASSVSYSHPSCTAHSSSITLTGFTCDFAFIYTCFITPIRLCTWRGHRLCR